MTPMTSTCFNKTNNLICSGLIIFIDVCVYNHFMFLCLIWSENNI